AQQSNIGIRTRNDIAVIPELNLQLGYDATSRLRFFIGYNVMVWTKVARPGDQIDAVINSAGGTVTRDFVTGLQTNVQSQGRRPAPIFGRSDVTIQGLTFGAAFRY
ncbi:MAG: BBP7 family outer membrane beta-barrel protein, partial [Planctomycetes bacterium]|nr:BBP7 family outer membrane beta-barrel protein [Planctomycetota bacterium]